MTIKLLTAYDKYPQNAIVTLDAGTEAGLITAKIAQADTTGGVVWAEPEDRTDNDKPVTLSDFDGFQIGGAAPNAEQRAAVRAGIGALQLGKERLVLSILGNSIASATPGFFSRVIGAMSGAFSYGKNSGVGSDRTSNMLTRVGSDISSPTQVCLILEGTNDAYGIYTDALTLEDHCSNMRGIIENLILRNILPVVIVGCPRAVAVSDALLVRNADIAIAAEYGIPAFDVFRGLIDPATGEFLAGASDDGVHPSQSGFASAAAEFVTQVSGVSKASLSPVCNISPGVFSNCLFLTDSNADGLAEGYSRSGTGLVKSLSSAASDGILGNWQNCSATDGFQYIQSAKIVLDRVSDGSSSDAYALFVAAKYTNTSNCKVRCYVEWFATNGTTSLGSTSFFSDTQTSFEAQRFYLSATAPVGAAQVRMNLTFNPVIPATPYEATASIAELQIMRYPAVAP